MSLTSQVTQFLGKLSPNTKLALTVGAGAGVAFLAKEMFFSPYKTNGLPDAKNLKGFSPTMTRHEATKILNLPQAFTKADVQKQHRVLMSLLHPDKGGNSYIAMKINEARDFLSLGTKI
ncbi:mitochondrial import inner membrane translocase subunit tim14 [Histomonas meleagridis]|uniref:mitochondrial import inner membrane translocase subunit tim14 n=1 Tax=Histomonas meleagridis TaxID=135588 RepID=UPI003559F0FF|nr:mitochondrial import inner membrane translocase subunit tim14 [Histomonas meleagridis]KAH0801877.1 mitochondrial import inner membrane translocase subunit tim14 [Histomonas meleagridis]